MRAPDDFNLNKWLIRHGIIIYGNYGVQQCKNVHCASQTHEYKHYVLNMAMGSPLPHPFCWFCQSFGRFNCFVFHILRHRPPHGGPNNRQPDQLFLRQDLQNWPQVLYQSLTTNNWGFYPPLLQPQIHVIAQVSAKKTRRKLAYYEIMIRPGVRNIPANLNRFIPYLIEAVDVEDDLSSDSSSSTSSASPTLDSIENVEKVDLTSGDNGFTTQK